MPTRTLHHHRHPLGPHTADQAAGRGRPWRYRGCDGEAFAERWIRGSGPRPCGFNAALTAASEEPFDLLLCDVGLPDGSGVDLMHIMKKMYGIKGIAITGMDMPEAISQCKDAAFSSSN